MNLMKRLILYSLMLLGVARPLYSQTELSLDEYKEKVLSYNQDVKSAQATIKAAQAVAKEIKTEFFPQLDGSGSYSYDFNPPVLALGSLSLDLKAPAWSAGGQLTQNIYTGGKLVASYNSAKIQQDIAMLAEELSVDNISYVAEQVYWNTSASKAFWNTAIEYRNILSRLYSTVQTRYQNGYVSKMDLLKMETSLKEADYQVSKAQQMHTNSCILLHVFMGVSTKEPLSLTDSISSSEAAMIVPYENVLQQRPDYLIKTREIALQKQKGKIDRSEFLPKVYVGGSMEYGTLLLNLNNNTIWSPRVFAGVSVPLFHWGKSRHSNKKNKALMLSKELAQSAAADEIRKELETAVNNMAETSKQIEIARENLDVARQSLDLHTFSYEEGKTAILDVQAVQLSWLQAYVNLIQSYLNNKLSVAAYRKTVSE